VEARRVSLPALEPVCIPSAPRSCRSDPFQSPIRRFYLGISPDLLTRFYGSSFQSAETYFASLAFSIFPAGPPPSDPWATPQLKILSAISDRPPHPTGVLRHVELCRLLLGPSLADQLALPHGTVWDVFMVDVETWTAWALLAFGQAYSRVGGARGRRWETIRQGWFRQVIELVVVYHLGERRTTFAWRDADKHSEKLEKDEGEEPVRLLVSTLLPLSRAPSLTLPHVLSAGRRARSSRRQEDCRSVEESARRDGLCAGWCRGPSGGGRGLCGTEAALDGFGTLVDASC